ncbi:MAG: hypothetical protein Q8N99_04595 [Nanoarchaeota archaeon]|nr:hypothetical protein [Nanoarchaeota archaeon]
MTFALSLGNFYGIDSLVEFFIVLVAFTISYCSYKAYKVTDKKNYGYFSLGFLFIGISFIFKILSNLTLLYKVRFVSYNFIFEAWTKFKYIETINFLSFISYKIFHVLGFLVLFLILTKTDKKEKVFMFLYMSLIVVFFSVYFNFIFHVTLVLLLIFLLEHFYRNHKRINSRNSKIVLNGFLIMLFSHIFLVFSEFHPIFYLIGEILLLIAFSSLLYNQMLIRKNIKNKAYGNVNFSKIIPSKKIKKENETKTNKA